MSLPQFLTDSLSNPPSAGAGVHAWLYKTARQLHAHLPAGEIVRLLEKQTAQCGRHVPMREITAAVKDALETAWTPKGKPGDRPAPKWPTLNAEARTAITQDGPGLADLWELSPIHIEDNESRSEEIVDALFPSDSLLCCGRSSSDFDTRPRHEWFLELSDLQLIVPSPMSDVIGVTKDGRESKHTLSNTGPRRFLVVEFDQGEIIDEHAALLVHLAHYAPLVMAVHSGGKSLHGWFYCAGQPDDKVAKFFRYAVSLGADSKLWTRSQFCRMPDGTRDNGRRQTVFYFNPKPLTP